MKTVITYHDKIREKLASGYIFKEINAMRKGKNFKYYELSKKIGEGTYNIAYFCGKNIPKLFYSPIIEKATNKSIVSEDWHIPQSKNVLSFS